MFLGYENFELTVLSLGVPTASLTPMYACTSAILTLGFLDLKVLCFVTIHRQILPRNSLFVLLN